MDIDRDALADALAKHGTGAAAARALGISPRRAQRHIQKLGLGYHLDHVDDMLPDYSSYEEMPVITVDHSEKDHLYLYPLSDVHLGSPAHQEGKWQQWLDWLAHARNVSMLGMGDFFNAAIIGSKSEVYDERYTVGVAKRRLARQLQGIPIDAITKGNHEDRIVRAVGDCPVEDLADRLQVPYFPEAAVLRYVVGTVEYLVYARHGTGSGASILNLFKGQDVASTDIYITAHTHQQVVTAREYFKLSPDKTRCVRSRAYFISSGSFLGYEGYAAARGYAPTRIGAPRIFMDGKRHDVHASL